MSSFVQRVLFYLLANAYPLGLFAVVWLHDKPRAVQQRGAWCIALLVSVAAAAFAVAATLTDPDPWIMLRIFSYDQVAAQLRSPWLVHMSVLHFALGDMAIWWLLLHVSRHHLRLSWPHLALYLPVMLWCNVLGVLPWLLTPAVVVAMLATETTRRHTRRMK